MITTSSIMLEYPQYNLDSLKNPRLKRLALEHQRLHELCSKTERISYEISDKSNTHPPDIFIIHYELKSIIGIEEDQMPIYGTRHSLELTLPPGYPSEGAKCYMITPIWHPNVKWDGTYKGRVCVNSKEFGSLYQIDELILRVGRILQFQNYHAIDVHPHPEDTKVAQWVREFAEPKNIINKDKAKYADGTSLIGPSPFREEATEESSSSKFKISKREKPDHPQSLPNKNINIIRKRDTNN